MHTRKLLFWMPTSWIADHTDQLDNFSGFDCRPDTVFFKYFPLDVQPESIQMAIFHSEIHFEAAPLLTFTIGTVHVNGQEVFELISNRRDARWQPLWGWSLSQSCLEAFTGLPSFQKIVQVRHVYLLIRDVPRFYCFIYIVSVNENLVLLVRMVGGYSSSPPSC